ncbi:hypothetical protein COY95_04970 [Candidatus Woesearchaeota archaeon CG_4_10_14_0_8_um_filter_47_5]|nr:MAG: hypothetical protein COY95_04970 [Candidatus Woesearchaeota archaeon CG_4_10_14_0_8_um_filter_47_5]
MNVELRHCVDVVQQYALIHCNVSFKLTHNKRVLLQVPKTTNTFANIVAIYRRPVARQLIAVNYSVPGIEIMGFISRPSFTRAARDLQTIFVSGRPVKNQLIIRAVYKGYANLLMTGRHPFVLLNVRVVPEHLDVNVHPAKREVKFEQEDHIYKAVLEAVKSTLTEQAEIPDVAAPGKRNVSKDASKDSYKDASRSTAKTPLVPYAPSYGKDSYKAGAGIKPLLVRDRGEQYEKTQISHKKEFVMDRQEMLDNGESASPGLPQSSSGRLPRMRIIGQLLKTYILAETDSALILIDQHAAQERVLFERFMEQYKDAAMTVQQLITPIPLEVSPDEVVAIEENLEFFSRLGFGLEEYGTHTFLLRTTPQMLGIPFTRELFMDILSELKTAEKSTTPALQKEERIILKACKAAIKANQELTLPEMNKLIAELGACMYPFSCPHGRPTIIRMTQYELEKKFKRVV